jgi:hypothetical protein
MINGKSYGWEDISTVLPYGEAIGIQNVEYSDSKELDPTYGRGSNPTGYGAGNYSAEGKITVSKEEYNKFIDYAKKLGTPLYKVPPFPIVVSYANDDQPTSTDELKSCKVTKVSESRGQGDKESKVEMELKILGGIYRNGLAPN